MSSENDNKALLQQLRIDRTTREPHERPRRASWLIGALLVVAACARWLAWLTLAGARSAARAS